MKKTRRNLVIVILCGLLLFPVAALADSITPDTYSATIGVGAGESVTITKTVTVDTAPPTSALVDVVFLFDTTGSMGSVLDSATSAAETIMTSASSLGDVSFGVARYDDFPTSPYGSSYYGDVPFDLVTDLTTDTTAVSAGITSLSASGGSDGPEANLYALLHAATDMDWRSDSTRIIVWFGDSPGHDSTLEPSYPGTDLTSATAALTADNITVHAMNSDLGYPGWSLDDGSYFGYPSLSGQATAITTATGGSYFSSDDSTAIVDAIDDAIISTFDEYSEVTLDTSAVPSGVDVSIAAPSAYNGSYDRKESRDFTFDVTFTGITAGVYDFDIYAMVDGGRVATELDHITVGGSAPVPEPSTILLMGLGLLGLIGYRKKFKG